MSHWPRRGSNPLAGLTAGNPAGKLFGWNLNVELSDPTELREFLT